MLVALRSAVVWGPTARGLLAFLVAVVGIVGYKCLIPIHVLWGSGVYKALMSAHQSRDCVPWYFTVCFGSCACACFELVLVNLCIQWSAVVHMCMALSCLL